MIKTIFFDLDGTLLLMDQEKFTKLYFGYLSEFVKDFCPDRKQFINALYSSVEDMLNNDGKQTNEEVFWDSFTKMLPQIAAYRETFHSFYETDFEYAKQATVSSVYAKKIIDTIKEKGYRIILTTNPIFPRVATQRRIAWAGLNEDDFAHITTYENSSFCKPNEAYYQEVLTKFSLNKNEVLMVGNDTVDDMSVMKYGIDFYLVLDSLINTENHPLPEKKGTLEDFYHYALSLENIRDN